MKPTRTQHGFTLIELVVVIVILGILAATALPKFADLSKDARIATVQGLRGALSSAASIGYAKCAVSTSTCNVSSAYSASPAPNFAMGSNTIGTHYGYPKAWDADTTNIVAMIDLSGFTAAAYVGGSFQRVFTKDGAPTPASCSVTYNISISAGGSPTITTNTAGC